MKPQKPRRRLVVAPKRIQPGGEACLRGADHHYLTHVLRLEAGAALEPLDGAGGRHLGHLLRVTPHQTVVQVERSLPPEPAPAVPLTLLYGLSRGRRTDWVLQKATELGVDTILPCLCNRSVARPRKPEQKQRRWEEIIRAAARQADRGRLPLLGPVVELAQALQTVPATNLRLIAAPRALPLSSFADRIATAQGVAVAVGPEGGFTPEELDRALELGYSAVGLGPAVLRTETAALAAVTLVSYLSGRWEGTE